MGSFRKTTNNLSHHPGTLWPSVDSILADYRKARVLPMEFRPHQRRRKESTPERVTNQFSHPAIAEMSTHRPVERPLVLSHTPLLEIVLRRVMQYVHHEHQVFLPGDVLLRSVKAADSNIWVRSANSDARYGYRRNITRLQPKGTSEPALQKTPSEQLISKESPHRSCPRRAEMTDRTCCCHFRSTEVSKFQAPKDEPHPLPAEGAAGRLASRRKWQCPKSSIVDRA